MSGLLCCLAEFDNISKLTMISLPIYSQISLCSSNRIANFAPLLYVYNLSLCLHNIVTLLTKYEFVKNFRSMFGYIKMIQMFSL